MPRLAAMLAPIAVAASIASSPASATLVLDLATGGTPSPCGTCGPVGETFGWSFRVIESFRINQLGFWDAGADGLGVAGVPTGLWRADGTLLASVTITDASEQVASASADGEWLFEDIADLILDPGSYVIGSVFLGTVPLAQVNAPFTTIAQVAFGGGARSGAAGDGFAFPDTSFVIPIFGPTMRQAVPEPAGMALVGLGLLMAGFARRVAGAAKASAA